MRKTDTVFNLALQRLRYNKSRTLLTGIAILLTTILLTAIGTIGVAILDMNRQILSDYHASFGDLAPEQVEILSSHIRVETLNTSETFADIINGKMNGVLTYTDVLRDDRTDTADNSTHGLTLEEGHYPEAEDEICSSPSFSAVWGQSLSSAAK